MPNKDEYDAAIARVKSGQASSRDRELTDRMAQQAGSEGNRAREAQKEDAKRNSN